MRLSVHVFFIITIVYFYFFGDIAFGMLFMRNVAIKQNGVLSDFPLLDNLTKVICTISIFVFLFFYKFNFIKLHNKTKDIILSAAISVCVTYYCKNFLQYLFKNLSYLYRDSHVLEYIKKEHIVAYYNLLKGGGFPSGHMSLTVSALLTISYNSFLRKLAYFIIIFEAILIYIMQYHTISDIIFGIYLGAMISIFVENNIKKRLIAKI